MFQKFVRLSKNQRGQGLVEYLIVVGLVAVASIGIMSFVGQAVSAKMTTVGYALLGQKRKPEVRGPEANLLQQKDMGDFMNGVQKGQDSGAAQDMPQ